MKHTLSDILPSTVFPAFSDGKGLLFLTNFTLIYLRMSFIISVFKKATLYVLKNNFSFREKALAYSLKWQGVSSLFLGRLLERAFAPLKVARYIFERESRMLERMGLPLVFVSLPLERETISIVGSRCRSSGNTVRLGGSDINKDLYIRKSSI